METETETETETYQFVLVFVFFFDFFSFLHFFAWIDLIENKKNNILTKNNLESHDRSLKMTTFQPVIVAARASGACSSSIRFNPIR